MRDPLAEGPPVGTRGKADGTHEDDGDFGSHCK